MPSESKIPYIDIVFKQLATSAIVRSERGTAILIVKDNTDTSWDTAIYTEVTEVDAERFTEDNLKAIKGALAYNPYELLVVRADAEAEDADAALGAALSKVQSVRSTGWIAVAGATTTEDKALASWIIAKDKRGATYKGIVYQYAADDMHIVNFATDTVTMDGEEVTGDTYIPWILSLAAATNIASSMTYKACRDITGADCLTGEELEEATNKGEMHITLVDDELVIASGINSLTTYDNNTKTEDMSFIETVETMDMIEDDIRTAFKSYIGNVRNTYENQMLFVAACRSYLDSLETDENYNVLDPDYENTVDIDCESQRNMIKVSVAEAADWTDAQVKHYPYKRTMFLAGDIKKCFCLHNLSMTIQLSA
jgi:hypothetical protein